MKIILIVLLLLVVLVAGLVFYTRVQASRIEARFPAAGQFTKGDGPKTHFLDIAASVADASAVVFLHGASGNLNDQKLAFEGALSGSVRQIYIDRPGHGYSERGGADDPAKQAKRYADLLDELEIEKAVIVGHSLGASSAAAFAVLYPERVTGLLFLAPATHPWPGGVTWYYDVAYLPVLGHLFTETLTLPAGLGGLEAGSRSVFAPSPMPEGYMEGAAIPLVLRPDVFRNNATDVAGLNSFLIDFSKRYTEISAPAIIITGDQDDIVASSIHSAGLKRDLRNSELIVVEDVGHKPEYNATRQAVDAIMRLTKSGD